MWLGVSGKDGFHRRGKATTSTGHWDVTGRGCRLRKGQDRRNMHLHCNLQRYQHMKRGRSGVGGPFFSLPLLLLVGDDGVGGLVRNDDGAGGLLWCRGRLGGEALDLLKESGPGPIGPPA